MNLTEKEIDEIVISQANDDSAWDEPITIQREKVFPFLLSESREIVSNSAVLEGTPVFRGTHVPVAELIESLETGGSIDNFLEKNPAVKREQAVQILEYFKRSLMQFKKVA